MFDKGGNAIKELTSKNGPEETSRITKIILQKMRGGHRQGDKKSEMIKKMQKDTMKNYETESSIISEKEAKAINEDIDQPTLWLPQKT